MKISRRASVQPRGALIRGGFRPVTSVRGYLESRSPADLDDVLGRFPFGTDDVELAVTAAAAAPHLWGGQRIEARIAALRRFQEQLEQRTVDLIARLERETGRPHWECRREVRALISRIEHTAATAREVLEERIDSSGRVKSRPHGVVAVIGPAMLPLATSNQHIAAALVAGNAVVWKPSPTCPASAQLYAEALASAGLPPGVANVVFGDDDVGADLAAHAAVDCVVFTGSTANGMRLRQGSLARMDQKQILHLGAKNPCVVMADVSLELAAYEVATSAFLSAGQRCTSLSRVYVERSALDEFVERLLKVCRGFRIGPPRSNPFFGPLLSQARLERFLARLEAAREQGAEPVLRGERLDLNGHYIGPSVHLVDGRQSGASYQDEELFGPDLAVQPVDDFDQAVRLCNQTPYGLCAVLFAGQYKLWERFTREVKAGTLLFNVGTHSLSGRMPFGGVKASGQGGRAGGDALLALRREVSLQERHTDVVDVFPGAEPPVEARGEDGEGGDNGDNGDNSDNGEDGDNDNNGDDDRERGEPDDDGEPSGVGEGDDGENDDEPVFS